MNRTVMAALALLMGVGPAAAGRLTVVTTTEDLAALTRAVGGDRVDVTSIGRGDQDPHSVEMRPSHLLKLRKADLLIKVGLDLETWVQPAVENARNPKILLGEPGYLDASQGCEILEIPTTRLTRELGDIHLLGNPHYWLDPENGAVMAAAIAGRLAELSPSDEPYFQERLKTFRTALNDKMAGWLGALAPWKGTKVVTYHRSWPNFTRRFGLEVVGYVEPKPGVPPGPAYLDALVQQMRGQKVKVIIMEPYWSRRTAEAVAERAGAKVLVLLPSVGGAPDVSDYIALFDYDTRALTEALKQARTPASEGGR